MSTKLEDLRRRVGRGLMGVTVDDLVEVLLEQGAEKVWWCEEHSCSTPYKPAPIECWLKIIDRKLGEQETPCRMVKQIRMAVPDGGEL